MSTASNTVIVAPRGGPDNEHRDRLWAFTRRRWERLGSPIVEGVPTADLYDGGDEEPYNRSQAINNAVAAAARSTPGWATVVVIDADVLIPSRQVVTAVAMAADTGRAVLPFREYRPLTQAATGRVLADTGFVPAANSVKTPPGVMLNHVSSCIVVPRKLWDTVGGFDERFVGWGCEDRAFHQACTVLGGMVERVDGSVWHLWHPVGVTAGGRNYRANKALEARYLAAKTRDQMMSVLDGAR